MVTYTLFWDGAVSALRVVTTAANPADGWYCHCCPLNPKDINQVQDLKIPGVSAADSCQVDGRLDSLTVVSWQLHGIQLAN